MARIIDAKSGHTMALIHEDLESVNLPFFDNLKYGMSYSVRNWDKNGPIFFYVSKHIKSNKWHVWYRGSLTQWTGCGETLKAAIDGAQRDGWLFA